MTGKTMKKSTASKITQAEELSEESDDDRPLAPRKRKRLLASIAGSVASGIVQAPSESASTAEAIAEISVDIAEAILQQAGL